MTENRGNEVQQEQQALQEQTAAKPLLTRVLCNYLPVSNLERSVKWYGETLGLTVRKREPDGAILVLGNGQWLFLLETTAPRTANFMTDQWNGTGFEMFSLTFEVENIVELHKKLREQGAEVEPLTDYDSCGLQFIFKDPDGNKFNAWQDPGK
ncbi:VOC family protein [Paenibacillus sambharensis]|uniref:VOC family protein n=1 Tax=Paenibacillus sambharensis TaxID=1803190 RepID=A0A2W1LEM6_9BACL|nr:VOC family protein [Paenibacillus sambharensis]PZD97536.1 VOC family protein [Paenibacillus sambharensis]